MRSKGYIPITPNTSYRTVPSNRIVVFWYDANKDFISMQGSTPDAITSPSNAKYARFRTTDGYGGTYNNDISFNYPADDTSYHAYTGIGMIFGGTLNVLTGLMTVTWGGVDLGTLNYGEWGSTDDVTQYYTNSIDSLIKDYAQGLVTIFAYSSPKTEWSFFVSNGGGKVYFRTPKDYYTDATAFKTAMDGILFAYELATPFDIDLTPTEVRTLLNANNIYADTGNVDKIVYFKTGSEAVARLIEAYMRAQPEE